MNYEDLKEIVKELKADFTNQGDQFYFAKGKRSITLHIVNDDVVVSYDSRQNEVCGSSMHFDNGKEVIEYVNELLTKNFDLPVENVRLFL